MATSKEYTDYWDLDGKCLVFGLNVDNCKTKLEYPCVRISRADAMPKYHWCQHNLHNNWIWSAPVHTNYVDMYFKHADDAIMFKLKFGTIDKIIAY